MLLAELEQLLSSFDLADCLECNGPRGALAHSTLERN